MKNKDITNLLNDVNHDLTAMQRRIVGLITIFGALPPEESLVFPPKTLPEIVQEKLATTVVDHHYYGSKTIPTGPTGPTEEGDAVQEPSEVSQQHARERLLRRTNEMRRHFYGSGSVFGRFLSPNVISGGKGMLAPVKQGIGLRQYSEDVSSLAPATLASWPSGFYRSAATRHQQLYIKLPTALIVLDNLPSQEDNAKFVFKYAEAEPLTLTVSELEVHQIDQLVREFEAEAYRLSDVTQPPQAV